MADPWARAGGLAALVALTWGATSACGEDGGGSTSGTGASGGSGASTGSAGGASGTGAVGGNDASAGGTGSAAGTGSTGGATGGTAGSGGTAGATGGTAGGGNAGATGGTAGSGGDAGTAGNAAAGATGADGGNGDASTDGAASDAAPEAGCSVPSECTEPDKACMVATCVEGTCGVGPAAAGTACGGGVCNGTGLCGDCLPLAKRCVGTVAEICSAQGKWSVNAACPFVCKSGQCAGECVPGKTRCNGNGIEACDTNGEWQTLTVCSGTTPKCEDAQCEPATPSCASHDKTCGTTGDGYCCATASLPGGSFSRSYDGVSFNDASYTATVSAHRLDAYEVTVGRFRAFVNAGKGTKASPPAAGAGAHPLIAGSGWQSAWNGALPDNTAALEAALGCDGTYATWTNAVGANESRPINCVSWYEAFAFCAWDGGRLPTEAEWNFAASGGSEHRVYPWSAPPGSTTLSPVQASYYVDATSQCMGDGTAGCAVTDLVTAGSKPAGRGRWGHSELAGNVWEWMLDAYTNPYASNPCVDCAILSGSSSRVIRGGSFFGSTATVRVANRSLAQPNQHMFSVGLRCARAL